MTRVALVFFVGLVAVPSLATGQAPQAGMMERAFGRVPPVATAQRDDTVPAGTIAVTVVDEADRPVQDATVRLGVMQQDGARQQQECLTDQEGRCAFGSLSTGNEQSYRVNVPYQGAKYSTTPFRLDAEQGHAARVRRLPTTTDDQRLLQLLGRTMLEFRESRIRVTQETRLSNLGQNAYVFPAEGMLVRLPEGFTGFESRAVMTDQRVVADEEGLRIFGSVPPGRVSLTWWYDVSFSGSTFELTQQVPFRTIEYDVLTDHVDGMTLEIDGFDPPNVLDHRGRKIAVSKLLRRPSDPPLTEVRIRMSGIPSGKALPLIAVVLAVVFLVVGVFLTVRTGDPSDALERARIGRRAELLEEANLLEKEFAENRVGPKYHSRRRREIVDELAALFQLDAET